MTELFTDSDFTVVGYLKSELEGAGISSFIRNQDAATSMVAPVPMFWPVLCVVHDADVPAAETIIDRFLAARTDAVVSGAVDRACSYCGEMIPASFDVCWNCERPVSRATGRE